MKNCFINNLLQNGKIKIYNLQRICERNICNTANNSCFIT